jgi:hypothetical protein
MAEITLKWDGERLSICAGIWNPRGTDYYSCGQNVDEVAGYFRSDKTTQALLRLWRDWHLNDMNAGSPAQSAWMEANPIEAKYPDSHYDKARNALAEAGLNPDPSYLHNGKPYAYGSAWLKREIPADVIAEIEALLES